MLYNVRYEIASSEMMEQNLDVLQSLIYQEFKKNDPYATGEIQIRQAEDALSKCKQLNLTSFQIQVILGFSDCDGEGMVKYAEFAKICSEYIRESYTFERQIKKDMLLKQSVKEEPEKMIHPASQNLDHIELFRTFKKYDRNMNGTLDFTEYT